MEEGGAWISNNYGFTLGKAVVSEFKIDSRCTITKADCNKFPSLDFELVKLFKKKKPPKTPSFWFLRLDTPVVFMKIGLCDEV